jgi:hypothetical protein
MALLCGKLSVEKNLCLQLRKKQLDVAFCYPTWIPQTELCFKNRSQSQKLFFRVLLSLPSIVFILLQPIAFAYLTLSYVVACFLLNIPCLQKT